MADGLNNFFISAAFNIVENIPHVGGPPESGVLNDIPLFSLTDSPVTLTEISETIKLLKDKKTLDSSGISVHFIKLFSDQLLSPLQHIINLSLSTSSVPSQLKIAKVIPLFKQGDASSMDNYRPISLLSSFSKILEKVVCNRLCSFLDTNNLLSAYQFGFRTGHSTIHPMLHFSNHISKALNNKEHTIAIFCDLRKAFDSCDHKILLSKMYKLGIRGATLDWFANYLSNRNQYVTVNGQDSSLKTVKIGVPQGSILGPILFLIYINDLPNFTLLLSLLFADDTTLLASGKNLAELVTFVNNELHKISTYFRMNRLALHPLKTQFLVISNSHAVLNSNINLFINNNNPEAGNDPSLIYPIARISSLSPVPAVKFLGVYFDPAMNFKFHINSISTKISRALFMLRRCKNFLSTNS